MPELIFHTGSTRSWDPLRIEFWEHQGWNRFRLVYADTGAYPEPIGITPGNGFPYSAGDVDGDGLTDLLCRGEEWSTPDSFYWIVMTMESPDSFSYPCSLSWYTRSNREWYEGVYLLPGDDPHRAFICGNIWANVADNQNELRWTGSFGGWNFALRDFDGDGRSDIGTGWWGAEVWECTGDHQYELVWQDTFRPANGSDVFSTADIDEDSRPEFYESFSIYSRDRSYLYMYENDTVGEHAFTRTPVDSISGPCANSAGGDIDGDGVDECIWTTLAGIRIYKAVGNNNLLQVWEWPNDHIRNEPAATVYDVNGDGYNELLFAGTFETSIFEVNAVDLKSPNRGVYCVGDTVEIRWRANTPPRCDSLSLLLRRDSLWHLTTIATGLPATDTTYRWVVPSEVPETARVVVIAYGPGWQFDMSDSAITFIGGAVSETPGVHISRLLGCAPNPVGKMTTISYELASGGQAALTIRDVTGRVVRRLEAGPKNAGFHSIAWNGTDDRGQSLPAGVYFCRLQSGGTTETRRVTLAR